MNTLKQSFVGLLTAINEHISANGMPSSTIFGVAKQTVDWANMNQLAAMETQQVRMLSKVMSIVGTGMTGNSADAHGSVRRLQATIPVFLKGLSK